MIFLESPPQNSVLQVASMVEVEGTLLVGNEGKGFDVEGLDEEDLNGGEANFLSPRNLLWEWGK